MRIQADNGSSNGAQTLCPSPRPNVKIPNAPCLKKKRRRRSSVYMKAELINFENM